MPKSSPITATCTMTPCMHCVAAQVMVTMLLVAACGKETAVPPSVPPPTLSPTPTSPAEAPSNDAAIVERLDNEHYVVERNVLLQLALDGPAIRASQTQRGIALLAVSSGSVLDKLGLSSGDVIRQVNGVDLTSFASLRVARTLVMGANTLKVIIERNGNTFTRHYVARSQATRRR